MAYGNYGNRGGYGNNNGGYQRQGGYQGGGGGFQSQAPAPQPINVDEEVNARLDLFLKFATIAEQKGIKLEEISGAVGGWVTSILLKQEKGR